MGDSRSAYADDEDEFDGLAKRYGYKDRFTYDALYELRDRRDAIQILDEYAGLCRTYREEPILRRIPNTSECLPDKEHIDTLRQRHWKDQDDLLEKQRKIEEENAPVRVWTKIDKKAKNGKFWLVRAGYKYAVISARFDKDRDCWIDGFNQALYHSGLEPKEFMSIPE